MPSWCFSLRISGFGVFFMRLFTFPREGASSFLSEGYKLRAGFLMLKTRKGWGPHRSMHRLSPNLLDFYGRLHSYPPLYLVSPHPEPSWFSFSRKIILFSPARLQVGYSPICQRWGGNLSIQVVLVQNYKHSLPPPPASLSPPIIPEPSRIFSGDHWLFHFLLALKTVTSLYLGMSFPISPLTFCLHTVVSITTCSLVSPKMEFS